MAARFVNPTRERIRSVDEIVAKPERAIALFGMRRVRVNPDCGFATFTTFADKRVTSSAIAARQFTAILTTTRTLRARHHLEA